MSVIGAFGCLRSLRARLALDGVSWVWSGLVESAVDRCGWPRATESSPHPFPPWGVAPLGELVSAYYPVIVGYAALNSVPCLSIACIMMASLRASAIRAFRIVERRAIANAQSFSFSGPL